ncbi:hypothetical protein SJAG_00194 [Schizosaccharomyces japonicus yFS275]|uniref:Uncharacterized protein n=1 Tax=Schizosaccharomyces japonicus (strain yFS275 / FY16936) TaxID=402676 RepID=B6JXQ2_SCHJY|nr:hypothetical protein SJAG_00194 [Schizosaccharomyces japonicus yFS275]EEB05196.1 hypothetical protein SJAG_00194 [Schizosaccharomyces japonicus yFS275]
MTFYKRRIGMSGSSDDLSLTTVETLSTWVASFLEPCWLLQLVCQQRSGSATLYALLPFLSFLFFFLSLSLFLPSFSNSYRPPNYVCPLKVVHSDCCLDGLLRRQYHLHCGQLLLPILLC